MDSSSERRSAAAPRLSSRLRRLDGALLLIAGLLGLAADLLGYFFHAGPFAALGGDPLTIGAVEAHGLGAVIGFLLLHRSTEASSGWHLLAIGVHLFLAACNIAFWEIYPRLGATVAGYVSTGGHLAFAGAHVAFLSFRRGWAAGRRT